LSLVLAKLMPIAPPLSSLLILHTAMPTSAFAVVLIAYHGQAGDKRYVALCVVVTALLSCVTVPLFFLFVG
jgi:predicted permease